MLALSRRALLRVYRPSWVVRHGVPSISNQSVFILQIHRSDDLFRREGTLRTSTTCRLYYRIVSDCHGRPRTLVLLTMSTVRRPVSVGSGTLRLATRRRRLRDSNFPRSC